MRLEFVEDFDCQHAVMILHLYNYYAVCVPCKKYSMIELGKIRHNAYNWVNQVIALGPLILSGVAAFIGFLAILGVRLH